MNNLNIIKDNDEEVTMNDANTLEWTFKGILFKMFRRGNRLVINKSDTTGSDDSMNENWIADNEIELY